MTRGQLRDGFKNTTRENSNREVRQAHSTDFKLKDNHIYKHEWCKVCSRWQQAGAGRDLKELLSTGCGESHGEADRAHSHENKVKPGGSGADMGRRLCLNWDWLSLTRRPFTSAPELLGHMA